LLATRKAPAVRKHATASSTSLHGTLERLMDMVMEKEPQSVKERKGLLDALAEQLVHSVSYNQDPL
jgi:hypothetical protein